LDFSNAESYQNADKRGLRLASEITMEFERVSQKKPFIVLRLSHEDFVLSCGANKVKIAVHDKDENKT